MKKRFCKVTVCLMVVVMLAIFPSRLVGAPRYTVIDLGTLGGNRSEACSINDLGQVVGAAKDDNGESHPFLYSDGEMINLSILGEFTGGKATDINDYGQIVGWASSEIVLFGFPPSEKHAFIYSDGAMIDPGVLRGENGIPSAINDNGLITGEYYFSGTTHSFIYAISENDMHDLGTLGGSHSYGYGINEGGEVVGASTTSNGETHAFLYTGGAMTDLGTAEGNLSQAYDINNSGLVVGYFSPVPSAGHSRHPFLYDGEAMTDLGTLGGNSAKATSINNLGQVVGWSVTDASETHAFLYESGVMTDLNDLLPLNSNWDFLIEAFDINDLGQIVGNGRIDLDGDGTFDEIHAFLMTPVPSGQCVLLGWKYPGGLVSIDTETGENTLMIPSDRQIEGLAFDSISGVLYGVENLSGDNMLVEVDFNSENITEIGPVVGFEELTAMTFDGTTRKIYALDQTTMTLLEINSSTGEGSPIGNFARGAANGLAAQPISGDLFASVYVDPGYLARIEKTTGASTLVGPFDEANRVHVRALSFSPDTGVLFGNAGGIGPFADGRLVTINLATGQATPIGVPSGQITALAFVEIPEAEIEVPIDIKPQSCPNPLNTKSKGVLPVAILGTEEFDVTLVEPDSVNLEEVPPLHWSLEDVATPFEPFSGKQDGFDCMEEGPDGYLDLTLKFDTQEIVAALGDVKDGDVLVLTLTGNLQEEFGETPIQGEDVVVIIKKGKE